MKLNLTDSELSDLKGKHFASTTNASKKPVTQVIEIINRDGQLMVIHEHSGKRKKTPFSVFILRFPYKVNS